MLIKCFSHPMETHYRSKLQEIKKTLTMTFGMLTMTFGMLKPNLTMTFGMLNRFAMSYFLHVIHFCYICTVAFEI